MLECHLVWACAAHSYHELLSTVALLGLEDANLLWSSLASGSLVSLCLPFLASSWLFRRRVCYSCPVYSWAFCWHLFSVLWAIVSFLISHCPLRKETSLRCLRAALIYWYGDANLEVNLILGPSTTMMAVSSPLGPVSFLTTGSWPHLWYQRGVSSYKVDSKSNTKPSRLPSWRWCRYCIHVTYYSVLRVHRWVIPLVTPLPSISMKASQQRGILPVNTLFSVPQEQSIWCLQQ